MKAIGRRNFFALLGGLAAALLGAKTQAKATAPTGLKRFKPLEPQMEKKSKYPCAQDYPRTGQAGQPGLYQERWSVSHQGVESEFCPLEQSPEPPAAPRGQPKDS